jgi:hypothetical protein
MCEMIYVWRHLFDAQIIEQIENKIISKYKPSREKRSNGSRDYTDCQQQLQITRWKVFFFRQRHCTVAEPLDRNVSFLKKNIIIIINYFFIIKNFIS